MIRGLMGVAAVLLLAVGAVLYGSQISLWLRSEAVLDRRYTLPRSLVVADRSAIGVARGARLVRLAGCTGCHGAQLDGGRLKSPVHIRASNLRALSPVYADEDFDRAIRRGLRPDASSLWVMPSQAYVYVRDADVAAILGYLRALPPRGAVTPPPTFDDAARRQIAGGTLQPAADLAQMQMPPRDLGPHYSGGRYLAMVACGVCHGPQLDGAPDKSAPDLSVVTRYTEPQFFNLLRRGWSANGRKLKVMSPLARQRFHILMDWEIDPLYAYLTARAHAPTLDQISGAIH